MKKFAYLLGLGALMLCYACQSKQADAAKQSVDATTQTITDGTHCYEYRIGQDLTTVQLVMKGNQISGAMNWIPFEKDGAYGTLAGTRDGNEIKAVYSYTIEGSNQTEEVMFKIEGDWLLRKVGELEDPNFDGNLKMKDPANAVYNETYAKVTCQ